MRRTIAITMKSKILLILSVLLLVSLGLNHLGLLFWGWSFVFIVLLGIAFYDITQKKRTILRNFPVLGHFRFLLEMVRPEIQQYFIESDISGQPISRIYRSVVYQKAKNELETVPFGSELDLYADDYKWVNHSAFPLHIDKDTEFRIKIGNAACSKPYHASLLNISAMSYGALSTAAVTSLGNGAKMGGFYHNTGEGGLSPYHLKTGADLVWQLGTGYFGARDSKGNFDSELFKNKVAEHEQIKMIEIKISQGAKPGHGGMLPAEKVNEEIAKIRHVPVGKTVLSPPGHSAFSNPLGLCEFIQKLRELSGGLPVGFKLCIGRREEFIEICQAMKQTQIYPDFITIDGGEGGTGAAPFDFINFVGSPLKDALYFVDNILKQFDVRQNIKIIASGKVFTGFNLFEKLAMGADLCNSARGMMLALGCIQSYRCNSNMCPTGIATNNPSLVSGINIADKSVRVFNYHTRTMESLVELLGAAGLTKPEDVQAKHISCRYQGRAVTLEELFHNPG